MTTKSRKQSIHRVVNGDAMIKLRSVADESAQLVLADPPYGIDYRSRLGEKIINDDRPYIWWLNEAFRVCIPGGGIVCFTRWDVQEPFRMAIESAGFKVKSQNVWNKGGGGKGDLRAQFSPQHELVWWATKGKFRFPNRRPGTVLSVPKPSNNNRTHPTEKPVELMRQLIEATTVQGDLVVDPFTGTGASGVACVLTGRRFFGTEIDGKYARIARERIKAAIPSNKRPTQSPPR